MLFLPDPEFVNSLQYRFQQVKRGENNIEDVYDGACYQSKCGPGGFLSEKYNLSVKTEAQYRWCSNISIITWFNSKHSGQSWYCGNSVERVDKRLLEMKPPGVIVESLEVFNITFKFWKGNIILLKYYYYRSA